MKYISKPHFPESRIHITNYLPDKDSEKTVQDILKGLTDIPKHIPSVYFYDAEGSRLFQKITELPEYYLTRIENNLIKQFTNWIKQRLSDFDIIEIGSGDCRKISIIFDNMDKSENIRYIPLDICQNALLKSANALTRKYSNIIVHCIAADFQSQLHLVKSEKKCLYCFFGSTIGNLSCKYQLQFLETISACMKKYDMLLIGIDMVKSRKILEKAYNDSSNITARFNQNILNVVNSITGTDLDHNSFEHLAFYNEKDSRIEMHLLASKDMIVSRPGFRVSVKKGETIHTENSHKFHFEQIREMIRQADLEIVKIFTDSNNWYSLLLLAKNTNMHTNSPFEPFPKSI